MGNPYRAPSDQLGNPEGIVGSLPGATLRGTLFSVLFFLCSWAIWALAPSYPSSLHIFLIFAAVAVVATALLCFSSFSKAGFLLSLVISLQWGLLIPFHIPTFEDQPYPLSAHIILHIFLAVPTTVACWPFVALGAILGNIVLQRRLRQLDNSSTDDTDQHLVAKDQN